jgi:hypothetical protein
VKRAVAVLGAAAVGGGGCAAAASSPSGVSSSGIPAACAGGHTLAQSPQARVYSLNGAVYGCATNPGEPYKLGATTICNYRHRVDHVALAGTVAAYSLDTCGVDSGSTTVYVRRLTNFKLLHTDPATSRSLVEAYGSTPSIVVKADGAVAWIGVNDSILGRGRVIQVRKDDAAGRSLLDSGSGIQQASLKLIGSQLSWFDGGTRHAVLR